MYQWLKFLPNFEKTTIFYYYIRKSSFERFQRLKIFNKFQNHFFLQIFYQHKWERFCVSICVCMCVCEREGRVEERETARFWIQNRNFQRHKQNSLFQDKYVKRRQDLLFTDLQFLINEMRLLPHTNIINSRISWQLSLRKNNFSDCNEAERC